jgi:5'(3')-deoxyribonucleotidase
VIDEVVISIQSGVKSLSSRIKIYIIVAAMCVRRIISWKFSIERESFLEKQSFLFNIN